MSHFRGAAIALLLAGTTLMFSRCAEEVPTKEERPKLPPKPTFELKQTPAFDEQQAYDYVAKQVAFGPRVPNSEAHKKCAAWLEAELESFGLNVNVQEAVVRSYNDEPLNIFNITGQYKPEAQNRILLCAHWDSRPYADRDSRDKSKPIDGANDGASGVGVLLELTRAIAADSNGPEIGFDIVFFDAEDYGKPEGSMIGRSNNSWCLGSQYWASNIPVQNYKPKYGILLDMVGASNAVFPKEGISMYYAPQVMNHVWKVAHAMGYDAYFKEFKGNEITDDHLYLNQIANIPTIDIIHYEMGRADFGAFHHTHEDNMDIIDPATLGVVGNVLMQVIYQE